MKDFIEWFILWVMLALSLHVLLVGLSSFLMWINYFVVHFEMWSKGARFTYIALQFSLSLFIVGAARCKD